MVQNQTGGGVLLFFHFSHVLETILHHVFGAHNSRKLRLEFEKESQALRVILCFEAIKEAFKSHVR